MQKERWRWRSKKVTNQPKVKILVKWYKPSTWFSKWKYELLDKWGYQTGITGYYIKTEYVTLHKNGWIEFEKCYRWDGASGPTWDTENCRRGALVHDGLYQLLRTGKLPQKYKDNADQLLHDLLVEDGMSRFRAGYWYLGVRLFGANSCKLVNRRNEMKDIWPGYKTKVANVITAAVPLLMLLGYNVDPDAVIQFLDQFNNHIAAIIGMGATLVHLFRGMADKR